MDIQGAAEDKKVQRRKIVDRAKADVVFLEAKMKEQNGLMDKSEEEVVAAQNKVTENVEKLIVLLREHEAEMMMQLTKINETQHREHTKRLTDLQLCINELKDSIEYDEDVLQKSECFEILQADNAAFSLREENLNIQEIELYRPRHVNYVLNQEMLNASRPLVLGKLVTSHIDASKSFAEGQGLKEAELGVETNFKVTTRDSQRNQFYDEEDQVIVKVHTASGENEENDIKDFKDGSYTVRYTPKRPGLHEVRIEVNGQQVTGSPWTIKVIPHRYKFTKSVQPGMYPRSIALNDRTGQIAVAGYHNNCIQLFDKQWKHLKRIGSMLDTGHPMSLAFLRNDDLIFTKMDAHLMQMLVYSAHDQSIRIFSKHVIQPLAVFREN